MLVVVMFVYKFRGSILVRCLIEIVLSGWARWNFGQFLNRFIRVIRMQDIALKRILHWWFHAIQQWFFKHSQRLWLLVAFLLLFPHLLLIATRLIRSWYLLIQIRCLLLRRILRITSPPFQINLLAFISIRPYQWLKFLFKPHGLISVFPLTLHVVLLVLHIRLLILLQ